LNATDETSLQQSFARVAEWILRQQPWSDYIKMAVDDRDIKMITKAVKRWFDDPRNDRWLLVYDNYDNPKLNSANQRDESTKGTTGSKVEGDTSQADIPTSKAYDIRPFFPDCYQGAIIVTTRSSTVKLGKTVQLEKPRNLDDSLEILALTSHQHSLENGEVVATINVK
ncbi:uncharacterized protein BCR38DRAFT_344867, partial [Pseudomassariella vexata]